MAVIDIGTTSIRMAIAQIEPDGSITTLESLARAANLGRDAFTRGSLSRETIEECVRVLRNYLNVLREYGVESADQIRVVATTAVREADNRLAFLDRVYIATGVRIEPIDEAEANRLTYLAMQDFLASEPALQQGRTLVTEVGGGSTELLLLQGGDIVSSHTYRLGSFRLRKSLEAYRASTANVRRIMEAQIRRTVVQIQRELPRGDAVEILALGGDVRFAARILLPRWAPDNLARIPADMLEELTHGILARSTDEIVRRYRLTFPEAETVGPALLTYLQLARALKLDHIFACSTTLRDGMLKDIAVRGAWTESFRSQILRSALDLGRKFDFNEPHARRVAELSSVLFLAMQDEHRLEPRHEVILHVAALLHDIGHIINVRSHHKHSMYLIQNSELFGLSRKDVLLTAIVARYHRRAAPRPLHEGYATLDRENRIAVSKLAALLRIADALDRSDSQRVGDIACEIQDGRLVISVPKVDDLSLEQLAIKEKGTLFEDVYGMTVELRRA
ncbi:MAG: Ppx/GppA phosphatase family protein [Planctomycetota bacterium]